MFLIIHNYMMFYDEFDLMDHFNKVCGAVVDSILSRDLFKELDARTIQATIPCDMQFHDIDEWWNVDYKGKNFLTLYLRALKILKDCDQNQYADHFQVGFEILKNFPTLHDHLQAKLDKSSVQEADMIRYLPHKVSYAYKAFMELDGFKSLQQTMQLLDNVGMDVILTPTKDGDDIHAPLTYDLLLVLETGDGKPLASKFKHEAPKRRLH